jgi:DnaJ-class molecular chaperone
MGKYKGAWMFLFLVVLIGAAIAVWKRVPCKPCGATGKVTEQRVVQSTCPRCKGSGTAQLGMTGSGLQMQGTRPLKQKARTIKCAACKGTGVRSRKQPGTGTCTTCRGSGKIPLYRDLLKQATGK